MTNIVGIADNQIQPSLSSVVPVKDEEATLGTLFRGVVAASDKSDLSMGGNLYR